MSTTQEAINTHCIDVCNGLLRGEIAAVETYGKAIEKYIDSPSIAELRRIRTEHSRAVTLLTENVRSMGGKPDNDSGAWGIFASAVQNTANLLGVDSAVESLKKGEESGRKDYQDALLDDKVMTGCKNLIREELLPPVMNHIASLERLEHAV